MLNELQEKIAAYFAKKSLDRESRYYIGASLIGNPCDRRNWIAWKGFVLPSEFRDTEKQYVRENAFDRGHREETRIIKLLQELGYEIKGRQRQISHFDGNFKGHIDGIIKDKQGTEYVLEIKTMKEKYFNQVKKHGIEKVFRRYFIQIQMYMHFLKIPRGLFYVMNKNDDDFYLEKVSHDLDLVKGTLMRIQRIIYYGDDMPARLGTKDNIPYECKCCDFFKYCYSDKGKTHE